jgi:hypothetical protein
MKVQADGLQVTRDEATELCIHHLRLAATFFECGSQDEANFFTELDRQCPIEDLQKPAMRMFLTTATATYNEAAERD